jgi:acetyltransferase-like isoleucine patch superfamily enzyme
VFIEGGVVIGEDVTIKNASLLFEGVTIADGVFIGPGVRFTNDARPRSPRAEFAQGRYDTGDWLLTTYVGTGASIGAGAIILPGVTVGAFSMVAAGSVIARDVASHAVV